MSRRHQIRLILLILFVVFVFSTSGLSMLFGGAALGFMLVMVVWRWPILGMTALIVVGTIHSFLMVLVFHFSQSTMILRIAQIWKEVVVVVLLAKVLETALQRRSMPKLHFLDLGIFLFLAWGAFYLLYPSTLEEATLFSKVLGLRADAFFLLAYFVGRGIPISKRQIRVLVISFGLTAFIVALLAGLQFIAPVPTNAFFERIGFSQYMQVQRGDQAVQFVVRERVISGARIPRASSFFLSDLALAFYTLLAVPMAASIFFNLVELKRKVVAYLLILATSVTSVLTVTRSALIALVPALAAQVVRGRKLLLAFLVVIQIMVILLLVIYFMDITPDLLRDIFSPGEASVQGHISALEQSVEVIIEEPLGRGLGTAGQIAQRFTPQGGITNESWYLQIATEMGVLPAILFIFITLGFGLVAFQQYGKVDDPWLKSLCLGMAGATVGFGLVSITLHAWEALTTSIMFWLFAGFVVRAHDRDQDKEGETHAHRHLA